MVKDGFIELQKKTRQSKDTVKPQLQKVLLKRSIDHGTLGEFYQTKVCEPESYAYMPLYVFNC